MKQSLLVLAIWSFAIGACGGGGATTASTSHTEAVSKSRSDSTQALSESSPLTEKQREKLDSIVRQMQENGEADETIQKIVDEFRRIYVAQNAANPERPQSRHCESYELTNGHLLIVETKAGQGFAGAHGEHVVVTRRPSNEEITAAARRAGVQLVVNEKGELHQRRFYNPDSAQVQDCPIT